MRLGLEMYLAQCLAYNKCLINVAYLHNLLLLPLLNLMNFYCYSWISHIGKLFGITWLSNSSTELWKSSHIFPLGWLQSLHYEFITELQNLSLENLKVNFHWGRNGVSYKANSSQNNSSLWSLSTPLWSTCAFLWTLTMLLRFHLKILLEL